MATQYPNVYYEELAKMIIVKPSLSMMQGEVCFYQGTAKSYKQVTELKVTPKKKTSFFWTPWIAGIKQKKTVDAKEITKKEYYSGTLYITNMRLVFECAVDHFNLIRTQIASVNQHRDGIRVIASGYSYNVMTPDVKTIVHILDIINKAQGEPQESLICGKENIEYSCPKTISRNDDYATAAFVHYCSFGGKPISKDNNCYPRWFEYDFNVNNPSKYHQKVVDEGYLVAAPVAFSLKQLKVENLKQILITNGLSDKGKKEQLIQRIVDEVDTSRLDLETIYIPTERGEALLGRYEYLFIVKKYNITVSEFELQKKNSPSGKTNDIIWSILGNKYNEHYLARDFGLARNVLLSKAELLSEEKRQVDSLMHFILVLFFDMSGCGNCGAIDKKEDLCLAPRITKEIYDRREYFAPKMIEHCFERYILPHHYFNKESFEKLVQMIFDDDTIDIINL